MMQKKKASVTIFLALCMLMFLVLCLVLVEGARVYYTRVKAMQAMELAEFLVLSEYQKELFDRYGLFFLDLDYEQGDEQIGILDHRIRRYLSKNIEEVETANLQISNFRRATDGCGSAYFLQSVEQIKLQSGYKVLEDFFDGMGNVKADDINLEEIRNVNEEKARGLLSELKSITENRLLNISLPSISFPSIASLREAVFGNVPLSDKSIILSERLQQRQCRKGVGEEVRISFADNQLFHCYLFQNFGYYGFEDNGNSDKTLEYQMEYIVAGKDSDEKNIEDIMWRIFLLRAGGNYLFYHQDAAQLAKAEAEAVALVGITGNVVLINAVRELFLIAEAIDNGIQETKIVFAGGNVPLYENGIFEGIRIGYEQYLYLFLNTVGKEEKIYRSMDIIELEIRKASGYELFRFDHCVDVFEVEWTYLYDGLLRSQTYEHRIKRTMNYEM